MLVQPRWQNVAMVLLAVLLLSYFMHVFYGRDLFKLYVRKGCRRVGLLTGIFLGLGFGATLWSVRLWLEAKQQKRWLTTVGIVRSVKTSTTVRHSVFAATDVVVCSRRHNISHSARNKLLSRG